MTSSAEPTGAESALNRLIAAGFRFVHPRDEHGDIVAVVGVRAHGTVIDVVRLEGEDDVTATRMPGYENDILRPARSLWTRTGALHAVVADLLALHDDDFADRAARKTKGCWVPGSGGRAKFLLAGA
jgi:hypothetical protein